MSKVLQLKRGNTAKNNAYTGEIAELTYDTELKQIRVHDGSTAGGIVVGNTSDPLPSQTGQSGKFLTTNGTTTSWATVSEVINSKDSSSTIKFWQGTQSEYDLIQNKDANTLYIIVANSNAN